MGQFIIMDTKKCSKCKEAKPLEDFGKDKRIACGYRPSCKGCVNLYYEKNKHAIAEYNKRYYEGNKPAIAERHKRYKEENKPALAEYKKRYQEENKPAIAEYNKRYKEKNKPALAEYNKRYREENKESISEKTKQYNQANKESIAERRKLHYQANKSTLMTAMVDYARERRATDPLFKLTHNVRNLIGKSFTNGGFSKKSKTAEILGCTFKEYYKHIEALFTDGMSWDLMGEIHIDHRLPVSAATTEAELLALNHYSNLQPMWATDNLAKSDSYCPKELAAYLKKHLPI